MSTRIEHDLLGEREVPANVYYGVHTARALDNFPISGVPISAHTDLVVALASVKQAAAETNLQLGLLDPEIAEAIVSACVEIRDGSLHEQFVVDQIQGGAGTSTNMNANEVIANRALELLGHERGAYHVVHPLEHVNLGQSTNDVYPTALKVALGTASRSLERALRGLVGHCGTKSVEFADMLKLGRTQLQDAVPMTLGQEFGAYAVTIGEDADRISEASMLIAEINLGGTAIGTGLNAHPAYAAMACDRLRHLTGLPLTTAGNLVEATSDVGAFVQLSGVTKRAAVKLSKICNDLRLLSSGPRAGLRRDQPSGRAGGLQHHARQGEPRHPRGREPGRLRGDRQRSHHHDGRRGRAVAAQRVRTDHRPCAAVLTAPPHRRGERPWRALHSGNHGQRRPHARHRPAVGKHRHGPQPGPRLRSRHRTRRRGHRHRRIHTGAGTTLRAARRRQFSPTC